MKAKNLLYIKQIVFILAKLIKLLGGKAGSDPEHRTEANPRLMEPHVFMSEAEIFNLDLFKLVKYIEKSKIAHKLHGFSEKYSSMADANARNNEEESKGVSGFLKALKSKNSRETPPPQSELL